MTTEPPLILISGPTASGKSALALRLAQAARGEIINADSVQLYRRLDIGSAKPSAQERALAPHHLLDHVDLWEPYDAGRFARDAEEHIAQIRARGALPIVCGGTGLYLQALLYGVAETPEGDAALRARLQGRAALEGPEALYAELAAVDPDYAARIHPRDLVRIIRALEVWELTGRPLGQWLAAHQIKARAARYAALHVALSPPRAALYARIDQRVEEMMAEGLLAEVDGLIADGYNPEWKPLGSLGYRQLIAYRRGEVSGLEEAVRQIKRDHRHYAKRQLTWLRGQPNVRWFEAPEAALAWLLAALEGRQEEESG
jgi:tRNA dimethylallyltransferase